MNPLNKVWEWIQGGTAYFIGAFGAALHTMVGKTLGAFGLSMISMSVVLPNLKSFVMQYASGMSAEAMGFLGAIGLGQAMSMVFSAMTVRWASKVFIVPTGVADQIKSMSP